jgi:hypothetical protein
MKTKFNSLLKALAAGAVLMGAVAGSAMADQGWHEHEMHGDRAQMAAHMQEHVKARLDRLAGRLEIKASQEQAWEGFAQAVENLFGHKDDKMDAARGGAKHDEEDAAALIRHRADRTADKAKKLAAVADAADKLQAVLTDEQRKILNREVRRFAHGRHHDGCRRYEGGRHDEDGMHEREHFEHKS